MKKSIWALPIVLLLIVSTFTGCCCCCCTPALGALPGMFDDILSDTPQPEFPIETEPSIEIEPEEPTPPDIEKKDYGSSFYLSILPDVNPMKYYWVEKSEGDAMSEAIYARQEEVYDYLGVEVVASSAGNYQTYVEPFRNAVEKRDGSVDCLISHVQTGVSGFVQNMYLSDLNQFSGIDLSHEHWDMDIMAALAIDGSYYLGFSDFNSLYTHVIAFNKDMLDRYAPSMEKSLYQLVEDYEWTLDEMLSLAQLVSIDKTGDGKTADDTYGLTGQQWVPWIGLFHASNINLVEMNESGKYEISLMNATNAENTNTLVKKLKDFTASEYAYLEFPSGGTIASPKVPLTSGRALMQLTSTYSLEGFLNYDINFGVVPYPMFDTNQKNVGYRSLQWGGYLCVPSYVTNELMVGETLEILSFYSDDVMVTFYEKMLGKQVADVPEDAKMLDEFIWDTVTTDFGQTYGDDAGGVLYFLPTVTRDTADGGKEMMSHYNSFYKNTNKSIEKFIKTVTTNKAKYGK